MRVEASGGIRVFVDIRGTVLTVCLSPEEVDGPTGALLTQVLPVRWQRHLQQVETPSPNASSSEDKVRSFVHTYCAYVCVHVFQWRMYPPFFCPCWRGHPQGFVVESAKFYAAHHHQQQHQILYQHTQTNV